MASLIVGRVILVTGLHMRGRTMRTNLLVNIYSYCPVDNLSYRAEVLGIIPMSIKEDEEQQTIKFVAMACIPWRKE